MARFFCRISLLRFGPRFAAIQWRWVSTTPRERQGEQVCFFWAPQKAKKEQGLDRKACLPLYPQAPRQRAKVCDLFAFSGPRKKQKGHRHRFGTRLVSAFRKGLGLGEAAVCFCRAPKQAKRGKAWDRKACFLFSPAKKKKRKKHQQRFGAGKQLFDSGHETSKLARSEVGKACSLFQTPPKSKMQRFETGKVCLRFSGLQKQARGSLCMDSTQCQCNFLLEERTFCPGNSPAIWPRPMLAL